MAKKEEEIKESQETGNSDQKASEKQTARSGEDKAGLQKTEVKNAHASGDGAIGREEED